jgi:cytochrome P450
VGYHSQFPVTEFRKFRPLNIFISRRSYYQGIKVLNEFVNPYIEQALRLSDEELEKRTRADEDYTFLHAIASFTKDRQVLRDQIVAVLLAGRDTTACTLSWLFYLLSMHPHVTQKLRLEIMEHVGLQDPPTYKDLKSMRYLQHTMNEVLRLYPVVPYNLRVALRDTTLPHGGGPNGDQPVGVLDGTMVGYSTLLMQRREDLYPSVGAGFPPILDFVPERWDEWTPKSWT